MSLREGSLFSGYNGLGMAVAEVFGAEPAWFSEIDDAPSKILAHHWPDIPNHGDITQIDWDQVEPVDILSGGFPCQDVSLAGKRAGLGEGTRSGLWSHFALGISKLRPQHVVIENVRGLLSAEAHSDVEPCPWCLGDGPGEPALRALGAVLGDLADLGYDAQWCGLRAADVGAPHGRYRVFVLAEDTHVAASGQRRLAAPGQAEGGRPRADAGRRDRAPTAHPHVAGPQGVRPSGWRPEEPEPVGSPVTAPDPESNGRHEGWPESTGELGRPDAAERGAGAATDADDDATWHRLQAGGEGRSRAESPQRGAGAATERGSGATAWGQYTGAILRWERILGRTAPAPTEPTSKGSQRLSPAFVEFMMGLPAGHVTAVPGVNRNAQLKALGNGVVPDQAAAALKYMTDPPGHAPSVGLKGGTPI